LAETGTAERKAAMSESLVPKHGGYRDLEEIPGTIRDYGWPAMRRQHLTYPAWHDKMVGLVEAMLTADGLRLAAYGQDENEMRIVKDLPRPRRRRSRKP
jgi:hypothetical protein